MSAASREVAILWSRPSAYFIACVNSLAEAYEYEIHVFIDPVDLSEAPFHWGRLSKSVDSKVNWYVRGRQGYREALRSLKPHLLIIGGNLRRIEFWLMALRLRGVACRVACFDTPIRDGWRHICAKLVFRTLLKWGADRCLVPGARQIKYAEQLGIFKNKLFTGLYAGDIDPILKVSMQRNKISSGRFIFVGRLEPVKGFANLIAAYAMYRQQSTRPWSLTVCGAGSLASECDGLEGVVVKGFVQPADLPSLLVEHSALILPSLFEPWGVVVHEAAAAGLGLLCSNQVGSADAFVVEMVNGKIFDPLDPESICRALIWFESLSASDLAKVRLTSLGLARKITPEDWSATLHQIDRGGGICR